MYKKGQGKPASSPAPSVPKGGRMMSSEIIISRDPLSKESSSVVKTVEHPQPGQQLERKDTLKSKDLMISYSHADNDIMLKIRDGLERSGISVWVDVSGLQAGVDFLSKIGEAIIDCKLFLSLLSEASVKSKYVQDELALAYISNRAIFPVTLDPKEDLHKAMDTGMKLQLARYEWTELGRDANKFEEKFEQLLMLLKQELRQQHEDSKPKEEVSENSKGESGRPRLHRQKSRPNMNTRTHRQESTPSLQVDFSEPEKYWKEKFGAKENIPWSSFVESFKTDYTDQLSSLFDEEGVDWLMNILHREMEVEEDGVLNKCNYLGFCNVEGEFFPLWDRVDEQARESWSMKEVFDMNSSVRVEAIENLGKFHSAAVIDALRDLLLDEDANVRAVAAVSLARTEVNDPVTCKYLMKTLNDKDRLVREAGCLALGHLKVKQAISKLLHLWRNDVISHVREAANVALNQIGGPEVEKQMKVTKVLTDEIRQLTLS